MIITMKTQVVLHPRFLDTDIDTHILNMAIDTFTGKCFKDVGYILNIIKIIRKNSNCISRANSDIVFSIEVEVDTLKPVIGLKLLGEVCMVYEGGIFVDIMGKMKVLVPPDNMPNFDYIKKDSVFRLGDENISIGSQVYVILNLVKYEKQQFSGIGKLI